MSCIIVLYIMYPPNGESFLNIKSLASEFWQMKILGLKIKNRKSTTPVWRLELSSRYCNLQPLVYVLLVYLSNISYWLESFVNNPRTSLFRNLFLLLLRLLDQVKCHSNHKIGYTIKTVVLHYCAIDKWMFCISYD